MSSLPDDDRRKEDLSRIRATYERYTREGRSRLWDPVNPGYARMMRDRDAELIALLRRDLREEGGGRVLDLGCGDGRLAGVAQAAGLPIGSWTGVDLVAANVAAAAAMHPWAEFVEASADELRFEDGLFDVVVATTLFSSLPSRTLEQAVATEVGRVLTRSGSIVWYDLRYDNPANPDVHAMGRDRIERLFPGWRVEVRSMTLLPPIARRLGPLTGLVYGGLEAVPLLRSHLVGTLTRAGA